MVVIMDESHTAHSSRRRFLRVTGSAAVVTSFAGCPGGGGGDIGETVTVGTLSNTNDSVFGVTLPNGARIAADEINADGGIDGADVELVAKNTETDPRLIQDRYRELVSDENVDVVLGPVLSEGAFALLDPLAADEQLIINPVSGSPRLEKQIAADYDSYKYLFHINPNTFWGGVSQLTIAEARLADFGWESVALLTEDYAWTKAPTKLFRDNLERVTDVSIVEDIRYDGDTTNFTGIFDRIESAGADAAFTVTGFTTGRVVSQWGTQQPAFEFFGINTGMGGPHIYQDLNGECEYATAPAMATTPGVEKTSLTQEFQDTYESEHGNLPTYPGYYSYDAVRVFADAVREVESTDSDELVDALEAVRTEGTTGNIEFYGQDETVEHYGEERSFPHGTKYGDDFISFNWYQWQEGDGSGEQVSFWPEKWKNGDRQVPHWL